MPMWFQWVVLFAFIAFGLLWCELYVLATKHSTRHKLFMSTVAMAHFILAALTLWFIAGGGR